ncbi:hypothetical protein BC835DRAFT_1266475 [Cytidiella melzeri]|nr:hypothetical protein BC835DRAFT_1266475 [Cytidiella melzeri]
MSKLFCCCIPVRFGVFLFSLLSLAGSGFLALVLWAVFADTLLTLYPAILEHKTINNIDFGNAKEGLRIGVAVAAGIYTVVAIIALLGFIGSIFRSRRLVKIYSSTVWLLVLLSAAATAVFLYFAYSGKDFFNGCEVPDGNGGEQECHIVLNTWQKIVYTVVAVVELLFFCYVASVIGKYVDQLESERMYDDEYRLAKPTTGSTYAPTFYPQQAQETQQGLLNQQHKYPYTDEAHRFGSNA